MDADRQLGEYKKTGWHNNILVYISDEIENSVKDTITKFPSLSLFCFFFKSSAPSFSPNPAMMAT